jgi:hypothetical protein
VNALGVALCRAPLALSGWAVTASGAGSSSACVRIKLREAEIGVLIGNR